MSKINNGKDEPGATLPANDAERWIAGTYAIWSEYCGGSCRYLGGYEKTAENAKEIAKVLYNDWLVKDHKSGVETIEYLLKHAGPAEEDFTDEEDFEDNEEYGADDEDFEDDEEYDEDEEDFEDDEEYDEDEDDFEDDEEYGADEEDFEDDEEYDEYDADDEDDDDIAGMSALIDTTAFDYACACNMCGRMYIAGYFTREESIYYATKAAKKIQEKYNSWVEYFQAYILGAAVGSNVRQAEPFIEAFQKLMGMQENPIYMDWNIEL